MAFDRSDTKSKVVSLIAAQLKIDATTLVDTKPLIELGADSLDIVDIIMELEETFGIEIPDADADKIKTINDMVEYINSRRTK
jgi:acyl carrier protein